MSVKGSKKRFCKNGHDKSVANGTMAGGSCRACRLKRNAEVNESRSKPKQEPTLPDDISYPWNKV